jgi:hypothetical protein
MVEMCLIGKKGGLGLTLTLEVLENYAAKGRVLDEQKNGWGNSSFPSFKVNYQRINYAAILNGWFFCVATPASLAT